MFSDFMKKRFIADAMLGDVARWLRMISFDMFCAKQLKEDLNSFPKK